MALVLKVMRRLRWVARSLAVSALVALPVLASSGNPVAAAPAAGAKSATVHRTWQGRIYLAQQLGKSPVRFDHRVIRDQAGFEAFIATIPSREITMTQPAPPSDDPLLKKPAVAWATKMVLVAIRGDSMYVGPELIGIRNRGQVQTVTVRLPPLGDSAIAAAQLGVGTYQAVLVDRFRGAVRFETEP